MANTTHAWLAPAALGLALAALPSAGQEPEEPPTFEEELAVTEVLLDVLVTDQRGAVIVGLGKDDFVVTEQGQPVEITSATFYSNRAFLGTAARADELALEVGATPTDRYFVLFFHDQRQDLAELVPQMLDAGRWTKRWARRNLLRDDYVAVVSYDVKLKVHQDFSTDKGLVDRAIESVIRGKDPGTTWPSRIPAAEEGPSLRAHLPQGEELLKATFRIYDALRLVAEATQGIRGRKNLLFYSIGFGEVDEALSWSPDTRYWPAMEQALNDHNVAVYAVDLFPSREGGSAFARSLNDSLSTLAEDTGGRYYLNFASFATPLEEVAEDTSGYYLLSYTARYPAGTSGYRQVEVEAKNRELRVRARQGYLYGSD